MWLCPHGAMSMMHPGEMSYVVRPLLTQAAVTDSIHVAFESIAAMFRNSWPIN